MKRFFLFTFVFSMIFAGTAGVSAAGDVSIEHADLPYEDSFTAMDLPYED